MACKESKPADPAAKASPTPTEQPTKQARPRPQLQPPDGTGSAATDDGRERPRLPDEDSEWGDPDSREAIRERIEDRRRRREEMLDTNKDGVVSDEERVKRMEPMRQRLDTNADGKLTPEELASSERRRMPFTDPAAVDANGDGDISLEELDLAVTARRQQMRERWRGRNGGSAQGVGAE